MTTVTYTFDHRMRADYTVTRTATVTIRRGGVVTKRHGKSMFFRARFPRLLAWQAGRGLVREGYSRADDRLYAEWRAVHHVREPAVRVPYVPFGRWLEARSAAHGPAR